MSAPNFDTAIEPRPAARRVLEELRPAPAAAAADPLLLPASPTRHRGPPAGRPHRGLLQVGHDPRPRMPGSRHAAHKCCDVLEAAAQQPLQAVDLPMLESLSEPLPPVQERSEQLWDLESLSAASASRPPHGPLAPLRPGAVDLSRSPRTGLHPTSIRKLILPRLSSRLQRGLGGRVRPELDRNLHNRLVASPKSSPAPLPESRVRENERPMRTHNPNNLALRSVGRLCNARRLRGK